jgi:hypothetical protein
MELEQARTEAEDGQIDDASLAAIIARAVASAVEWHLEAPEHTRNATLSSRSWRPAAGPRARTGRDREPDSDEERPPRGFDRRPRREYDGPPRDFEDRPPRRDFDDRPPRRDLDDRPPRRDFDDRPPREYGRPRREREFDDRPPRRDFDDRPPRRDFQDRPPRRSAKPFRGGGSGFKGGGFKRRPPRGR